VSADLHTHSYRSDGTDSPKNLVHAAAAAGLDVVALTDHDSAAGWDEASAAAAEVGIGFVPGMEVSCTLGSGAGSGSVHLLAYGVDPRQPMLAAELDQVVAGRADRLPGTLHRLRRLGIDIDADDVRAVAGEAAALGRPHVADALVAAGVVADRQEAFVRAREILRRNEDSPEWQDALRLLAGRLSLPKETLSGLTPKGGARTLTEELSPKMLLKGERLERSVLAACVAHPALVKLLAEIGADHFDSELHRRFREELITGRHGELTELRAELDARASREGIDERTGKELMLNLRERRLRRELAGAELERVMELQTALTTVRSAFHELR